MNKPFQYKCNENDHLIGICPFSGRLIKISIDYYENYETCQLLDVNKK